jgi:surface protein
MIYNKMRRTFHRFKSLRKEKSNKDSGFSMLEAVVVVGVLLALAVGGFISYGTIVENAKSAKAKSAASEVHTAIMIAAIDGDPTTNAEDVISRYNASQDIVRVYIFEENVILVPAMPTAKPDSNPGQDKKKEKLCIIAERTDDPKKIEKAGDCSAFGGAGGETPTDEPSEETPPAEEPVEEPAEETPPAEEPGEETPPAEEPIEETPPVEQPPVEEYIWDTEAIMVTTWDTSLAANCTDIQLPITSLKPGFTVNWGDGSAPFATVSGNPSHSYGNVGPVTITTSGQFDKWGAMNWPDANCLTHVTKWGNTGTADLSYAFHKGHNLKLVNAVPPVVDNMNYAFAFSNANPEIKNIRTPSLLTLQGVFMSAVNFDNEINFDTSNVVSLNRMFYEAKAYNKPLKLNTFNVTNMSEMFYKASSFNQPLNDVLDTSNVTNMGKMFADATNFNQPLDKWNTSKVGSMYYMFYEAFAFNQNLSGWDVTAIKTYDMFSTRFVFEKANKPQFVKP